MPRKRHHIVLSDEQSRLLESVAKAEPAARRAIVVACRAGIPSRDIQAKCGRSHPRIFAIAKSAGVKISDSVRERGQFRSGIRSTTEQRQEIVRLTLVST